MALLSGTELYTTQVGPDSPKIQFDMQIQGTLQDRYDQGFQRASLKASLMNPDLTRADSKQAKEEYIKMVNQDLQRVGGINWAISENVDQVEKLFGGLYSNKLVAKDAIWTDRFKKEMSRAESFKNCQDPSKCGGQYWDEGVKYMMYKKKDFENANTDEALGFGDVSYVPYNSVMDQAITKLKESGLSLEYDYVENGYLFTAKNGEKLKSPMTLLFNETLGNDPKFAEMFKVKSYVQRRDWASNKVALGEYQNEEEATLNYMKKAANENLVKLDSEYKRLNVDEYHLSQMIGSLQEDFENGDFDENSEEYRYLQELEGLSNNAKNAKNYLGELRNISQSGNAQALNAMADAFDNQNAFTYFSNEISNAVNVLAFKDFKLTRKPDEYAMADYEQKLKMDYLAQQHSYDVEMENLSARNDIKLEDYKLKNSSTSAASAPTPSEAASDIKAQTTISNFDYETELRNAYSEIKGKSTGNPDFYVDDAEWANVKKGNQEGADKYFAPAKKAVGTKQQTLKIESNKSALNNNRPVPFPEQLSIQDFNNPNVYNVYGSQETFGDILAKHLSKKYNKSIDKVYEALGTAIEKKATGSFGYIVKSIK